ncbi:hypothetical protein [Streptomyces griseofuscus]
MAWRSNVNEGILAWYTPPRARLVTRPASADRKDAALWLARSANA